METYSKSYSSEAVILETSTVSHSRKIITRIALKGKQPAVRIHIAGENKITAEQISNNTIAINIEGAIDSDYILKGLEKIIQMYKEK